MLFVSPSGESLLIDSGSAPPGTLRDVGRIMAAVRDAGITQIDHLLTSHYHADHMGGVPELATRIPIRHFIDYGTAYQPSTGMDRYVEFRSRAKHTVVKPGDAIPIPGLNVRVVSAAAKVMTTPLPSAGMPNPNCAGFRLRETPVTEDDQSIGTHITFGSFRVLYLADLQWNREFELMCPTNNVGTVDLWLVSRHGQGSPRANSPALVHAIRPRVAIMNNGADKTPEPDFITTIRSAQGFEDLWQNHVALMSDPRYILPEMFVANLFDGQERAVPMAVQAQPASAQQPPLMPPHNGVAYWIKVAAEADGTFTVSNGRNGFSKTYRRK
jgi:hypothetical protein